MTRTMTPREHYKILYREARRLLANADERGEGRGVAQYGTAHNLADNALNALAQAPWGYIGDAPRFDACAACGKVFDAVLWAVHWRFFPPVRDDVPPGMSERHLCFEMTAQGTRVWYARRLP